MILDAGQTRPIDSVDFKLFGSFQAMSCCFFCAYSWLLFGLGWTFGAILWWFWVLVLMAPRRVLIGGWMLSSAFAHQSAVTNQRSTFILREVFDCFCRLLKLAD